MRIANAITAVALACLLAGSMVLPGFFAVSAADTPAQVTAPSDASTELQLLSAEPNTYSSYYDCYADENRPDAEIRIDAAEYLTAKDGDFSVGRYQPTDDEPGEVLLWQSAAGKVSYRFAVPQTGIYCAAVSYYPMETAAPAVELSLSLDGACPYDTASRITLNKRWVNAHDITTDSRGNQVRPPQVQQGAWLQSFLGDVDGLFGDPLIFYLTAGLHTLTLTGVRAELALSSITFCQPATPPGYHDNAPDYAALSETPSTLLRLEGEAAAYKSAATLYPTYDNRSYLASPASPTKMVYNTIGGEGWKKALQTITWEVGTNDDNRLAGDGWYRLGIKARQDVMRGFYSNRRILIDGRVPVSELSQLKFQYDTDWRLASPRDSANNEIYIYLTADAPHTITLEVIPGEIGNSMRQLDAMVLELNTCYRDVMMITGPTPDKYTDYEITKRLPDIAARFDSLYTRLEAVRTEIEALSGSMGSEAVAIRRMTVILDKCRKKPVRIPDYLTQLRDHLTTLSAWMRDYRDQPLAVDYLELASVDRQFSSVEESFFSQLAFDCKALVGSFFTDYTTLSDDAGKEALNVWVQQGRDQALVVKQLAESEFTVETGIPVAVNLVVGGILEAALADAAPDIALFIGGDFPVNLAARGLLTDLSALDGFDETRDWFQENAMTQYTYAGGVYGLPISQSVPMLFYRRDILQELGIAAPPETWKDLISMLPALQRRYLGVGLVLPPANASPATEAGHTFALLTAQAGVDYYNESQTRTNFDDIRAVQAFETWTEFYTKYSFEQTYDTFSRFRTGLYPMVIANASFANQLAVAAPEIKGLWNFTTVPGTIGADGSISHAANSVGSAGILFAKANNQADGFRFLKWFSGEKTQVSYGNQVEGLLGQLGRFDAANTAALAQLAWSPAEYAAIAAQREALSEIPLIPAAYAVTRNLMNAFRETVNNADANPRDTLMWYNRDINDEIHRKRKNLGLPDGE